MNRRTVVTALLCVAVLGGAAVLVGSGLRDEDTVAANIGAAGGALAECGAGSKIDTGTAVALRPRMAERRETPVSVPRDGSVDESGLSLAERKANAKRVADASADAYRKIDEALEAWANGN